MYNVIRLIIGCIFLVCSIAIIKKSKVTRKKSFYIIFSGISLLLVIILTFLPFENLFITFDSPKSAYEYYNLGKSNIKLVIEGENCDFVMEHKNESDLYLIIPKTMDGWKIGIGSNTKRIIQKISNGIVLYVYQYKSTNDFFITIYDTNGGELTISDEFNTEFISLERINDSLEKTFVTYYAHIVNLDSKYSLVINGTKIVLGNQ